MSFQLPYLRRANDNKLINITIMTNEQARIYNDIMDAYKMGIESWMGLELGQQRAGTETQKQTYRMEKAKWIARVLTTSDLQPLPQKEGTGAFQMALLPEPYRTLVEANSVSLSGETHRYSLEKVYLSLEDYLFRRFTWSATPQGSDFWWDVFQKTCPESRI